MIIDRSGIPAAPAPPMPNALPKVLNISSNGVPLKGLLLSSSGPCSGSLVMAPNYPLGMTPHVVVGLHFPRPDERLRARGTPAGPARDPFGGFRGSRGAGGPGRRWHLRGGGGGGGPRGGRGGHRGGGRVPS